MFSNTHTGRHTGEKKSIEDSDLFSHCQSQQLLSAKQHCMSSWHNFINNLGKQRILQQIPVVFWLYCTTDNNCLKLSVVESICSCIMKKKSHNSLIMKTNGMLESYQEFLQTGRFNCFTSVGDSSQILLK